MTTAQRMFKPVHHYSIKHTKLTEDHEKRLTKVTKIGIAVVIVLVVLIVVLFGLVLGLIGRSCDIGWTPEAFRCLDVDECQNPVCGDNQICQNTEGSYSCLCKEGFDGEKCNDINECRSRTTCDFNAKCENLPGDFSCSCKPGFFGDGQNCSTLSERAYVQRPWKTKIGQAPCDVYFTSETGIHLTKMAFDGNLTTFWHSKGPVWKNSHDKSPAMKLVFQDPQEK